MKLRNLAIFSALLIGIMSSSAVADTVEIEAPITKVKVHRNAGAIITRAQTFDVSIGNHTILVKNLTNQLDRDYGIRASVSNGTASVSNVVLNEEFSANAQSSAQLALREQIAQLKAETAQDESMVEAIDIQLQFIRSLGSQGGDSGSASLSADQALEALDRSLAFVADNSRRLLGERLALQSIIDGRAKTIAALEKELRQTGARQDSTMDATVSINASSAGPVTLHLQYLVQNADWTIDADSRLDSSTDQLDLSLYARVRQQSGEVWDKVALSLSTAQIFRSIEGRRPTPEYLNLREKTDNKEMAALLDRVREGRVSAEPDAVELATTGSRIRYRESAFDASFDILGTVDIPADGSEQRFEVTRAAAPSSIVVRSAPVLERVAFVYALAEFDDMPEISRPLVSLSRDGTYVGRGLWPTLRARELLELPFGVDERIEVKLIKIPSEDGDTGIFNRRQVTESKQQFRLTNHHSTSVVLEVFDVRPNSMNEDLEIEALRDSTQPTETDVDGQPGVVMWRKELAPGENWEINHWYRMSFPADKRVVMQ